MDEQNIYEGLTILQRRESVPNVAGYMDVINEMRIPENIDDFQYHYRVSRHLFDIILGELYGTLVKNIRDRHSGEATVGWIELSFKHTIHERGDTCIQFIKINCT